MDNNIEIWKDANGYEGHIMDYTGSLSKGINPYSSFDKLPCRF